MPETIESLKEENARLRKHILDYRMIDDVPLLKNYQPFNDRNKPSQLEFDVAIERIRQLGAGMDGDNAYKRALCDVITGAMASGYQNSNQPPEGHWAKQFWDIGRAEGVAREELRGALKHLVHNVKATGKRLDLGLAMDVANDVLAKYSPLNPA